MKRPSNWHEGDIVAGPIGPPPLWVRLLCIGLAFVGGLQGVGRGVGELVTGVARLTLGDPGEAPAYDEQFTGAAATAIAGAWIVVGVSLWLIAGIMWAFWAACDRGRAPPDWQKRLLAIAAIVVLVTCAALVVPALLGVEGQGVGVYEWQNRWCNVA